jgi:hypothetical protein
MSSTRPEDGPDSRDSGSWATETLPLAVRRELLDRELKKLGFRKAGTQVQGGGAAQGDSAQQPRPPQRPRADPDRGSHGD